MHYGVLCSLHFQKPLFSQSKLVRIIFGKLRDIVVDIRKGSLIFGKYVAVGLASGNHHQLFIHQGFAHRFVVLSKTALFQYKRDSFYHSDSEGTIAWNDLDLDIKWPIPTDKIELSKKDNHNPFF